MGLRAGGTEGDPEGPGEDVGSRTEADSVKTQRKYRDAEKCGLES